MKRKTLSIVMVLLLLFLMGMGIWIAKNVVVETKPIWKNNALSQELIKGHSFALQQFLQQQSPQISQRSWRRWKGAQREAENTKAPVLLFIENVEQAGIGDYDDLLDWVGQGNHVVLPLANLGNDVFASSSVASSIMDETTEDDVLSIQAYHQWLASRLGLAVRTNTAIAQTPVDMSAVPLACQKVENQRQQAARAVADKLDQQVVNERLAQCMQQLNQIRLPEGATLAWLSPSSQQIQLIEPQAALWQGEGKLGSHIVRVAYGEGSVVMVSNWSALMAPAYPATDVSGLNQYDHAYLAAYLAQDKSALWFVGELGSVPPLNMTPAWWRMWQAEPLLMVALSLLIMMLVWYLAMRMGAVRQLPVPQERYLSTHLSAQGQFLARKPLRGAQLQWLQQQLWQQWQQQWPHWSQMDEQTRIQAICRHYDVPLSTARLWLQPIPTRPTAAQWLAYLHNHQRLQQRKVMPSSSHSRSRGNSHAQQ